MPRDAGRHRSEEQGGRPLLPLFFFSALVATTTGGACAAPRPAPVEAALTPRLEHLVRHECGACHGYTLRGGLGPALTPERLARRSVTELTELILDGVPSGIMPPWRPYLQPEEARAIARALRSGALFPGVGGGS